MTVGNGDLLQLIAMYFKQDACPLDAMKEMQFCAAQGRDHRQCCIRNGVTTTLAGAKCLVFCDQRPGQQVHISLIDQCGNFPNSIRVQLCDQRY